MKRFREYLEESSYDAKTLKKNRKSLDPDEREKAIKAGCTWHHGPKGEKTCAIWKTTTKSGKIKYCCNTHRAIAIEDSLDAAIKAFDFIKDTA
jgi:hypothetical protein